MKLPAALCTFVGTSAFAEQKPNIILCTTDDRDWGDVSYHGLTKIRTEC